mgnify:CR=1 FL=1
MFRPRPLHQLPAPVWQQVWHTMLPSIRTAVALATASPRHLPSFKFLKPQTGCVPALYYLLPLLQARVPALYYL